MRNKTEHIKPLNQKQNGDTKQIISENLKQLLGSDTEFIGYITSNILNFKSNDLNTITSNLKEMLKENKFDLSNENSKRAFDNLFRIAKYNGLWFNNNGFYLNGYRV